VKRPSGDVSMPVHFGLRPALGSVEMEQRQVLVEKLTSAFDAEASVASER
jgi:hypothetical protein